MGAPLGAPTPWATGRSSLMGQWSRGKEGEGMEGPGRLREKASTPVPMRGIRSSGCSTLATALRQPRTSERTWWRRAMGSRWGGLDHQKRSTIPRDRSGDP